MKYIFIFTYWALRNTGKILFWFIAQILISIWHFDVAKLQSPKTFYVSLKQHEFGGEMLSWTVVFLVLAIISATIGFGGIAGDATPIAKISFFLFLVLFVLSLIAAGFREPV